MAGIPEIAAQCNYRLSNGAAASVYLLILLTPIWRSLNAQVAA